MLARLLQAITLGGHDDLLPVHLAGQACLSQPFQYQVRFIASRRVDPAWWIGQPITIQIQYHQQPLQNINAIIFKFKQDAMMVNGQFICEANLVPWFYNFKLNYNCRIFENLSVPQIFQTLCKEHHYSDIDCSKLSKPYPKLAYCTQYNESTLDFLHRIFATAGIFYHVKHEQDKHILVLHDSLSLDNYSGEQLIDHFEPTIMFHAQKTHNADWNLMQDQSLHVLQQASAGSNPYIYHEYANGFANIDQTGLLAKAAIMRKEWQAHTIAVQSQCAALTPGVSFCYQDDLGLTGNQLVYVYRSQLQVNDILPHSQIEQTPSFSNQLICISEGYPFIPESLPKPQIHGFQSAKVVGPDNQSIYTDATGQVKVHFYWDHQNASTHVNTCWLPVAQHVAGKEWGTQFIPQVGQEVAVRFIHSDPDRPIVAALAYNEALPPPFNLPNKQATVGYQSLSHELSFNDALDAQALTIKSAKDINLNVLNQFTHHVQQHEAITVNGKALQQTLDGNNKINAATVEFMVGNSRLVLNAQGITIKAPQVKFLAEGVGATRAIAHVGHKHKCHKFTNLMPYRGGPVLKGSPVMLINGSAVARVGDPMHCLLIKDHIKKGVGGITVDGKPIAHQKSKAKHGGIITQGADNAIVGELEQKIVKAAKVLIADNNMIEKCESIAQFKVKCGHSRRGVIIDALAANSKSRDYTLQVIADSEQGDTIQIFYTPKCKNCPVFSNYPYYNVTGYQVGKEQLQQLSSFIAKGSSNEALKKDFISFFKHILIPNSYPQGYTIKSLSCKSKHLITVEAYAPVRWEGKVSLEFKHDAKKDSQSNENYKKLEKKDTWELWGEISIKRNNTSWTLGASRERDGENYENNKLHKQLFAGAQGFLDKITPMLGNIKSDYGEILLDWPNLTLSGAVNNIELNETPEVGVKGEINIDMDPFFGVTAKAHILSWLATIASGTPFGAFLKIITSGTPKGKQDIEDGNIAVNVDVNIVFSAGAKVAGNLAWSKEALSVWEGSGEVDGEIPLELEGHAKGSFKAFFLKAKAGVSAGAKSAVGAKLKAQVVNNEPAVFRQYYFNGLTIYWAAYYDYSLTRKNTTNHSRSLVPDAGEQKDQLSSKKEYKHPYLLFEPHYWPKSPEVMNLRQGGC